MPVRASIVAAMVGVSGISLMASCAWQLTVVVAGAGKGTVKGPIGGIAGACTDVDRVCTAQTKESSVTLTPDSDTATGSSFVGWGGDCAVQGDGSCVVSAAPSRIAIAYFRTTAVAPG